jgi:hypothetical protein
MVELHEAQVLLDPKPLPLEMGIHRLTSGQLHVAARTDMYGCKGEMFEWWFRFAPDTQQYAWWHPLDHVSSAWRETNPRTFIGSTHVVEEKLGGDEVLKLHIRFEDPAGTFGEDAVRAAREQGHVSALVCGHVGFGDDFPRDDAGRPIGGRLAHVARDTEWGMVLRSRFWLGIGAPDPVPDEAGLGLMQHAYTEFHYLSKFLPSLYIAENRGAVEPPFPW